MYQEPIFLEPVFQERIWGGQKLRTAFGYDIPFEHTGEAWVISAHPNGPNEIANGPLAGETLIDAWKQHPELFGHPSGGDYPLLVKILDAANDLSVQVHPDDTYAREVEDQPYGKTECWYVLDAEEGARIIFGHHAASKEEFKDMAENGVWNDLLRQVEVKAGDFIYVPSGTIHAIGKGIVILETQQSSDITYRVYDYNRTDAKGNTRELHLDAAVEVSNVPHETADLKQETTTKEGLTSKKLVEATYFTVYHWQLNGKAILKLDSDFLQVSVVSGKGEITIGGKTFTIEKGQNFILPATISEYEISGDAELIVSHP